MSALVSNADTSSAHNIQLAIYTLSGSTYSLVAQTNSISIPANAAKDGSRVILPPRQVCHHQ